MRLRYVCRNDDVWKFKDNLAGIEALAEPSPFCISRSAEVRNRGVPKRERRIVRGVSASEPRLDLAEAAGSHQFDFQDQLESKRGEKMLECSLDAWE